MAVSGIPEMSVSGTIPEVRLKVDMIHFGYTTWDERTEQREHFHCILFFRLGVL